MPTAKNVIETVNRLENPICYTCIYISIYVFIEFLKFGIWGLPQAPNAECYHININIPQTFSSGLDIYSRFYCRVFFSFFYSFALCVYNFLFGYLSCFFLHSEKITKKHFSSQLTHRCCIFRKCFIVSTHFDIFGCWRHIEVILDSFFGIIEMLEAFNINYVCMA